jgi:DNA-binding MarR family transcriptional regulator
MPCACASVKKLSRVLSRIYDAQLSTSDINNTQFAVLRSVTRQTGVPLAQIAERLEMDRTSFYRAIAPMIRDGWLKSAAGTKGRFRTAKVTRKGRQVLAAATKRWTRLQRQVIGRFGRRAYASLLRELHRLGDCAAGGSVTIPRESRLRRG